MDPTVPLHDVRTLEQVVADSTSTRRFSLLRYSSTSVVLGDTLVAR